jgi:hypothetical protein
MTTKTFPVQSSSTLLQRALLVDGVACIASGLIFTLGASPISALAGVPDSAMTFIMGLLVLLYGVSVFIPGLRGGNLRRAGWWGVIVNDVSTLLCIFLLAANPLPLTDIGRVIVILLGLFVAGIGIVQFFGLRQLK